MWALFLLHNPVLLGFWRRRVCSSEMMKKQVIEVIEVISIIHQVFAFLIHIQYDNLFLQ
jgi:hypothetical protein